MDLEKETLQNRDYKGASFARATLIDCSFEGCSFVESDFTMAHTDHQNNV